MLLKLNTHLEHCSYRSYNKVMKALKENKYWYEYQRLSDADWFEH